MVMIYSSSGYALSETGYEHMTCFDSNWASSTSLSARAVKEAHTSVCWKINNKHTRMYSFFDSMNSLKFLKSRF